MATPQDQSTLVEQYYSVIIKIPAYKLETEDVLNLYWARMPLQRIATLCYLSLSISEPKFDAIHRDIENNIFPKCSIEIWTVDIHKGEAQTKTKVKMLMQKNYLVTKIKSLPGFDLSKFQNSQVFISQLLLVNETIYYLEKSQRYNSSYHNITAYEALQKYNSRIASEFKDGIEFKENIPLKYINDFKYETITAQGYNDLIVPFYIIKNYKALMTHSYYFFDDFYYDLDSTNDVTVFFNTLTNDNQYKKININSSNYYEFQLALEIIKKEPIVDNNNFFMNDSKVYNFFGEAFDGAIEFAREAVSSVPNLRVKKVVSNANDDLDRFQIKTSFQIADKVQQKANSLVTLYAPDNIEKAKQRFANYSELVRNRFASIWTFESMNSFIDVIQLNKVYNFDVEDVGNYNFLPISILNRLSREDNNHKYLRSSVKFQALKFQ